MMNSPRGFRQCWQFTIVAIALLISFSLSSCGKLSEPSKQTSHPFSNDQLLEFVPKQALLAGILDTTVIDDTLWLQSNISQGISQPLNSWLPLFNLDLNQDIRPLLDKNIAFAITSKDLDRDQSNGRQNGYLLVIDTANGEQLREFLELFWQRQTVAGTKTSLHEVSGVPIIAGSIGQSQRQLATAVVGDNILLIANDIKVLRQSLQVAQAPTLQLEHQDCCTTLWLTLNIPEFIDWLGLASPNDIHLMSPPRWQKLLANIEVQPHRLVVNTRLNQSNHQPISPTATIEKPLTDSLRDIPQRYLPKALAWAAVGHNLRPLWTEISDELAQYKQLPFPLQQWQKWCSTELAQVLSEPFIQLLSSSYAIGQLTDGNWVMVVESKHSKAITQLDNIAKKQGLTISQLSLAGQTTTAWSRLKTKLDTRNRETMVETDLVALHTKLKGYSIFSTSLQGLTAVQESSSDGLFDTQRFKRTVQPMHIPNQGYMYGTWYEIERLLAGTRWFSLMKPIFQPWFQAVDAIAITSYEQTNNQLTGTVSILLKN